MKELNKKQKSILIDYLKIAAPKYNKYFLGKEFLIICDDYSKYTIRFVKKKFCHLTGLNVSINDNDFFNNCLSGKIAKAEINNIQHYDFKTLCKKCSRLAKMDLLLNAKTANTIFLENLHTHTADYPVAINNVALDTCIGFRGEIFTGVTLRTSSNSYNADTSKRIIGIFSKELSHEKYSSISYISNIKNILENVPNICEIIDNNIFNTFFKK